jgi:hypothetical protein
MPEPPKVRAVFLSILPSSLHVKSVTIVVGTVDRLAIMGNEDPKRASQSQERLRSEMNQHAIISREIRNSPNAANR